MMSEDKRAPWGSVTHSETRAPHGSLTEEERKQRKNERQKEYAKKTKYAANARSNQKNTRTVNLRFSINTESDILDYLDTKENKAGYIKELIRKDMNS